MNMFGKFRLTTGKGLRKERPKKPDFESVESLIVSFFKGKNTIRGLDFGAGIGDNTAEIEDMLLNHFEDVIFEGLEDRKAEIHGALNKGTPVSYFNFDEFINKGYSSGMPGLTALHFPDSVVGDYGDMIDELRQQDRATKGMVYGSEKVDLITIFYPDWYPGNLEKYVTVAKEKISDDGLIILVLNYNDVLDLFKGQNLNTCQLSPDEVWRILSDFKPIQFKEMTYNKTDYAFIYTKGTGGKGRAD